MTRIDDEKMFTIAAEAIDAQLEEEFRQAASDEVTIPEKLHGEMLDMFRAADVMQKANKKNARRKKYLQTVAAILLCTTITVGMTIGISEGLRKRVFQVFSYKQEGAVELRTDEEELLEGWSDYWYPAYLPEGYRLVATEDADHFMLFQNEEREKIRFYENDEESISSFDTDSLEQEPIRVGLYEGSLFYNNADETIFAIWMTDNRALVLTFDGLNDKTEIAQILEGMKYIK